MFRYLKYLIQLVLSPANGWADLGEEDPDPSALFRRGFLPLLSLTSLTELLALVYERSASVALIIIRAIIDFGVYFLGYFIAKIIIESYLPHFAGKRTDARRADTMVVMAVGLMVAIQLVDNVVPWNLVVIRFLPIYAILVLYRAPLFVMVPRRHELSFLMLASAATVVVPLALYYLFYFLLP